MILDPFDPKVIAAARESGIPDGVLEVAQRSPVYRYVKEWEMALPLHPEWRTLPMLFYVPPLMPVLSSTQENGTQKIEGDMFSTLENARLPIRYVANLLAAGNDEPVINSYQKMIAVRILKRAQTVGDVSTEDAATALAKAGITEQQAEAIYHLTSLASYQERFAIPPMAREGAIEALTDPLQRKAEAGFGKRQIPQRGW
jgi:nitrate reductase beta subunit